MDMNKLKIKIGEHEFEAEGPPETVQAQLAAFKELLASATASLPRQQANPPPLPANDAGTPPPSNCNAGTLALDKIMRTQSRIVSLTARPSSVEDSILLIIFGQRMLRNNEASTGSEIIDGLQVSGYTVDRIGRPLEKLVSDGHIIAIGANRGKRYRLTNPGAAKAQEIARTVIATVAY